VVRDSRARGHQKRLPRFRRHVCQPQPEASNGARRAVYEELLTRFGPVIVGRHIEWIAAVLDRAEEQAYQQAQDETQ
jgi:hypothetical protein